MSMEPLFVAGKLLVQALASIQAGRPEEGLDAIDQALELVKAERAKIAPARRQLKINWICGWPGHAHSTEEDGRLCSSAVAAAKAGQEEP